MTRGTASSRETYLHGHQPAVLRSHRWRTADNSAGYLLPFLSGSERLLDVGVGPGTITLGLARRLPGGFVVGIDRAEEAVRAAFRAVRDAGDAEDRGDDDPARVVIAAGDVYALPFTDASFDVVHAHQLLQHLADPVAALTEMGRVCRPGGLIAARDADYGAMTWFPPSRGLDRWRELYSLVAVAAAGEPHAGRRLRSWALAAGLREVSVGASVWCFADEADLSWWSETWADRLTTSDLGRQAVAAGLTDERELAALADAWRSWAREPGAWFAVLHGEVLTTR